MKDGFKIKGCFRINIVDEDGTIRGDSGWVDNQVTNKGLENYLAYTLFGIAGSLQVNSVALGTGTAPATDGTVLPGEVMSSTKRTSIGGSAFSSRSTSNGSCSFYAYATFPSGFLSAASSIQNIGLFKNTATNDTGASLFAGQTYNSSQCNSNQAVNVTYQIQLG